MRFAFSIATPFAAWIMSSSSTRYSTSERIAADAASVGVVGRDLHDPRRRCAQHLVDGGLVEPGVLELLHEGATRERLAHERDQRVVLAGADDHDGRSAADDREVDRVVVHELAGARTVVDAAERDRRVEVAGQVAQIGLERGRRRLRVARP